MATTYKELRTKAEIMLGSSCFKCGIDDTRVLHFHHIFDKEKDEDNRNGMFKKILNGSENIILVCANCHMIIHSEMKEGALTPTILWIESRKYYR